MRPEPIHGSAAPFSRVLDRTLNRLRARQVLRAVAIAAGGAAVTNLILLLLLVRGGWRIGATAAVFMGCTAGVLRRWRRDSTARSAAVALERADTSLRNLAVTAVQLLESPETIRPYMRERVYREASARTSAIDLRRAVPLAREAAVLVAVVAAALVLTLVRVPAVATAPSSASSSSESAGAPAAASATDLIVELTPPAYTGRTASRLVNPASLEVLGGTEAAIRAPGGSAARIRVNGSELPVRADGTARVTLTDSGYVSVESGPMQRLLPPTVTPDAAPIVRVTAPAKDLRVSSNAATIPIAASADDDLGLASFELRYTVVSGSGEQFTFTEGTLPASVQRGSDRSWQLATTLALSALKLEPGDALIYRAVAADRRPAGTGTAASDTFFIEIAGPGDVPLEGVEMPPERERYAMSQAMIVLKLERLQGRENSLTSGALAEEAGNIAAEQRAVRANFIFLLGGEVEDEEVEAEHSHEISEGRFANQARKDIVAATVLMTHVEKALAAVSTREALPPARAALKALQRAFGNSRYLLRALPSRVRLDPARRLTGDTSAATNWDRALAPPSPDPLTESARAALAELLTISAAVGSDRGQTGVRPGADASAAAARQELGSTLRDLGERILTASARAPDLRPAAADVAAARTAIAEGRIEAARAALRRAAAPLVKRAQQGRIESTPVPRDAARLAGAAALGRGGSR
jgi:hypothetical protein